MHNLHLVVAFTTLLAVCGTSNSRKFTPQEKVLSTNPDDVPYSVSQEEIQRFFASEPAANLLHTKTTGSVTLCCHQFSYTIYGRLYNLYVPLVYDGLIQDDAVHRLVVLNTIDPDFALEALKSSMKRYMMSIGLMNVKPCHLQYSPSTISSAAECTSGNTIDCDQHCRFTCETTNAVSTLSTCCDNGTMIPQIPTCQGEDKISVSTNGYPKTPADMRETTTGTAEENTAGVKNEHVTDGNITTSQVYTAGTSATDSRGTKTKQGFRNLELCGLSALAVFIIIPFAYLAWRKFKNKQMEFLMDNDELGTDDYEDVEPDCNGSYQHRSILPANPTDSQLDQDKVYDMSVLDKGFAYILNNRTFWDHRDERKGSELDVQNVKHIFEEIGYKPVIFQNLTAQAVLQSLEDLTKKIKPSHPSVVLMIMSHGDEKGILGVDGGHVTITEIKDIFSGQRCSALIGKPKIIFVQACRGVKKMKNVLKTESQIKSEFACGLDQSMEQIDRDACENPSYQESTSMIEPDSAEADIAHYYIAQSTTHGYFSLRSRKNGSFFIQALCEEFLKRAHEESLDIIMNMVTRRVQSEERHFRSGGGTVQVPQIVKQGIDKDIVLLPKYPR